MLSITKLFDKEHRTLETIRKLSGLDSEKAIEKLYRIYYNTNDEYIKNYSLIAIANSYNRLNSTNGTEALKALEAVNLDILKSTPREYCDYLMLKMEALMLEKADKTVIKNLYGEAMPYFAQFKDDAHIQLNYARFEQFIGNHDKAIELYKKIDFSGDWQLEYNTKLYLALEYIYKQDFINAKPYVDECVRLKPMEKNMKEIKKVIDEKIKQNT